MSKGEANGYRGDTMKRTAGLTRIALAGLTLLLGAGLAAPSQAAITNTNLLKNPDFETSYLPEAVTHPTPEVNQPVWPVEWLAEGAAELFDHAASHDPFAHHGKYFAQVSGSWSGPRKDCSAVSAGVGSCTDIPGGAQKDQLAQYYSVAPAWRNQTAIGVTPGTKYTFSAWISTALLLDGTGAVTKVRWLDATGVPIGISNGPTLLAPNPTSGPRANYYTFAQQSLNGPGPFPNHGVSWTRRQTVLTAPANARGAILLLGAADSAWIGSVSYDYVCFSVNAPVANDICQTTYAV
jgi:hypothetical protein